MNQQITVVIKFIVLLFLIESFVPPFSAYAAPTESVLGDVFYDASKALATEGSNQSQDLAYYFSNSELDFGSQSVNVPAGKTLTKVILRDKYSKKEIRDLPITSANSYELKVQGEENVVEAEQESYLGYFEWFRAPERKRLWMYDYDETRYYHWNQGVYDIPQPTAKISSVSFINGNIPPAPSTPALENGQSSSEGHMAWDLRNVPITVSEMRFSDPNKNQGLNFPLDKVSELGADLKFLPTTSVSGSLRESDIIDVPNDRKIFDINNRMFKFSYKARFVISPEDPPVENSNGRVIRYYNQWLITYKAKVYKYTPFELVAYFDDGGNPPVTPPGDPKCAPTIQPPVKGTINTAEAMDPKSHAVLRADNRGSELFDVAQGIPTSENLFANAFGLNYLFQHKFANMTGEVSFQVEVTRNYVWVIPGAGKDAPPIPMQQRVTQTMTVKRPYSYWQIDNLEVYKLQKSTISNYALGGYGGTVQLEPNGYTAPTLQSDNKDDVKSHVQPANCKGVDLGTAGGPPPGGTPSDFQSAAEGAVGRNQVNNDKVNFNGQTIMDNAKHPDQAPVPGKIPLPSEIGADVLYKNALTISNSLVNKINQPTTGKLFYQVIQGNIKGGADKDFDIGGINTVSIHTPVVDYSYVSDDAEHNQKTVPNYKRSAFILDRPFTVTIPTKGQHQSFKNYGNRDYRKWTRDRQVRFEFGVMTKANDNASYIAPGTWISYPDGVDTLNFYMPVWVDEGDYKVYTRAIAENAPSGFTTETEANMNWQNHVATKTIDVEVIGRLYDFRVTDIADYNWETVFRKGAGSSIPSGVNYPVGDKGIDGDPNGFKFPYELPIRRGSHPNPEFKNVAVKTGYHFKFDLKSKGNMFGSYDSVRVKPSFTFVDMDGNRQPVDLYYHSDSQKFIKIGSAADVQKRYVTLDSRLRNVPKLTIQQTAETLHDLFAASSGWNMSKAQYTKNYLAAAQKQTYIGGYDVEVITAPLRTFIGGFDVPTGVSAPRKAAAIQQWYGEYSLPAAPYVVQKGFNLAEYGRTHQLDDKSSVFMKKGYIIVNFDIETIRNGDLAKPHLQYINTGIKQANQWKREGFNYQLTDPYGLKVNLYDGDVVFYNGDKSSNDDFGQSGTH
ncbi:hypothetical protein YDYSY3_39460 [Paenibacillus chitinolyticus]|uniref:DUF5704 domain-containing protein n=1 Tax=Paenibacillus chitinolyticus TaxID=79263 RepID=UPI0026E4D985|nr:DUF5704 domain-containing protein [Paenibacillus chitinolyticus]GKS12946.1 hypothetical protein YDYSY3_39460 [Paenibacillus chitinolyticus]